MIRRPPRSTLFPYTRSSDLLRGTLQGRPEHRRGDGQRSPAGRIKTAYGGARGPDRKSTRLNSSHLVISYAGFCLQKKKIMLFECVALSTRGRLTHTLSDQCE